MRRRTWGFIGIIVGIAALMVVAFGLMLPQQVSLPIPTTEMVALNPSDTHQPSQTPSMTEVSPTPEPSPTPTFTRTSTPPDDATPTREGDFPTLEENDVRQTATALAVIFATQWANATRTTTVATQAAGGVDPDETEIYQATQQASAGDDPTETPEIRPTFELDDATDIPTEESFATEEIFTGCGDNVCLPDEIGLCAADCGGITYTPVPLITFTPTPTLPPGHLPDTGGGGFSAIGSSSAYVFHDKSVRPEQQTTVELKLFFDTIFITATPTSARTAIPITQAAPRPEVDSGTTATPRSALYSEDALEVPDRLIAILDCGTAFTGCGAKPVLSLKITQPNEWLWRISPAEAIQGKQSLTLELWMAGEENQPSARLWFYNFEIEVLPNSIAEDIPDTASPVPLGMLIAGIAGLALAGGIVFSRRKPAAKKKIGVTPDNAPRVFISYRRSASAGYGQILHDKLAERGAEVFLDVRDLHAGEFGEDLKESIATSDYFLLLLAPGTLQSQWVVKEAQYAREKGKIIIPILINDFDLYGDEMPEALKWLQQQNAIPMPHLFVDAAIDKIATFIGLAPKE